MVRGLVAVLLVACGGGDEDARPSAAEGSRAAIRAIAGPAGGQWSSVIPLTLVPAAAANLANGKVVLWSAESRFTFSYGGQTYTTVFDPATGTATERLVTNTGHNMFCPGTANLPDGRLLVSGGIDADRTSIFDANTNTWSTAARMNIPRGYQANCVLEDGRVFTVGGSWSGGVGNKHGEIWSEANGWQLLPGVPVDPMLSIDTSIDASFGGDSHFWLLPAANGRVFHAGPGVQMHWISTDGNGSIAPAGPRGDDVFSVNGSVAMYDVGKILKTGGAPNYEEVNATANSYLIDINAGAQVRKIAPMNYPRAYHNSVVLPNGQVMIIGGMTWALNFSDDTAVLRPELFDPATETFTLLPPISVPRNYHSVALLLPDGRVLSSGGGLCGDGCSANHPDLQIYSPHYLFNADGTPATRPVIQSAPATAVHGTKITVVADTPIASFALVRESSTTHTVNNDQRRIPLAATPLGGTSYELAIPSNPGVVLPGNYMLFALNADGVPSVSTRIRVTNTGAPVISNPGDPTGALGAAVTLLPTVSGATQFAANGLPPGLGIDSATGRITGTPTQSGRYAVTLIARNAVAETSTAFLWTIAVPTAPVQFVRLEALGEVTGGPWSSMAEFDLLGPDGLVMARSGWSASADSVETTGGALGQTGAAVNAIDGSPTTMWHTQRVGAAPPPPHQFTVNLGGLRSISGFRMTPRNDGSTSGIIAAWRFWTSADGVDWTLAASGNFADLGDPGAAKTIPFTASGGGANRPPTLAPVGPVSGVIGMPAQVALSGSDPDGDALTYSASGLPPGLSVDPATGLVSGVPGATGSHAVTAQVADGRGGSASVQFDWTVTAGVLTIDPVLAPPVVAGTAQTWVVATSGGTAASYAFSFGDGSSPVGPGPSASASHAYALPGLYTVTVTVTSAEGGSATRSFLQAVTGAPAGAARPTQSSNVAVESRSGGGARLWVVNQDNDSVSVFDAATLARLAEVPTDVAPRTLAVAPDGRIWVVNKTAATISVVSPATLTVAQTIPLPRGAMPYGIAFAPDGSAAYLTLEGTGELRKLDPLSGATLGTLAVGASPRHLAVTASGGRILVARFVTPPLPGEATAAVAPFDADGTPHGGEVVVVTPALAIERTVVLAHSNRPDTAVQGSGVPNYLGAPAISPDGASAWVPSKQDNVKRGQLRSGIGLDFQNTVRAIGSRIDLGTLAEDAAGRVDLDNAGRGSAALFHPSGAYLFVALHTSREVAVVDPVGRTELFRFAVGRAPDGLAVSADGRRLYVNQFMDRTLGVFDLSRLADYGETSVPAVSSLPAIATERLSAQVLQGKQLFYDAKDTRLARDGYISCAACHDDGGHDGRVWDFTGAGEGLRNTIALRGRAGGQGFLHWSNNFDEVQDFEGQIRTLAGGTGLMSDAAFQAGTRSQPLGDRKAGLSADLDALAAYVASLSSFAPSPFRPAAATLSGAALDGKFLFAARNCASCHAGTAFTASGSNTLSDIGTLKPSSGQRLGAPLTGIDVPTLRDAWATAPYLHDGSAPTIEAAIRAHANVSATDAEVTKLAAYVREIGADEAAAPAPGSIGTIWPPSTVPAVASDGDTGAVNLGVKFRSDVAGFITGVRFYKGTPNTGTHVGALWSSGGQLLASATFTGETASGWQQVTFASPVAIAANTTYVASYLAPRGRYAADSGYFGSAGFDNPPLHALPNGGSGGNGVYVYGSTLAFPNASFQSTNYWVDVVFTTLAPSDTTPPTVTATSPASGATGVAATAAVTATFSEPLDPATIGGSTFELRNPANAVVAATVSYNAATRVATLTPAAALAASTVYTATVRGGTTDPVVKDVAGNRLAASATFSFTTAAADVTPPGVSATSPAAGATGVPVTTAVTATFTEALDPASVGSGTFELRDAANAPVAATVSYDAATRVATLQPAAALAPSASYTATVRGGAADPAIKDLAGNRLAASVAFPFTTAAAAPAPSSIWPDTALPAVAASADTASINVGLRFKSDVAGYVLGVRFYKGAGNGGTHVGTLWGPTGTKLASATFTGESATGWQQVRFDAPVAIAAGSTYTVSTLAPQGRYAATTGAFATAGVDNGVLHALRDGDGGGNGVFVYAGNTKRPTNASGSTNYWVDLMFSTTLPVDTTPPTVVATTPLAGATQVGRGASVTATFSEAMTAASITTSSFTLRSAAGATVAAVVTYNATTRVATLNPSANLAAATNYVVTLKGGAADPRVKDAAGNALVADVSWGFRTK